MIPADVRKRAHKMLQAEILKHPALRNGESIAILEKIAYLFLGEIRGVSDSSVEPPTPTFSNNPEHRKVKDALSRTCAEQRAKELSVILAEGGVREELKRNAYRCG